MTGATYTNQGTTNITLADVIKAMTELRERPLADFMRAHGFDPAHGCQAILPESMRELFPFVPKFVRFSTLLEHPVFVAQHVLSMW